MPLALEQSQQLFIRRWGEMAGFWGINRTMGEMHALLYVAERALCTDEIMERLQISRGSVSINLRQLLAWDLVRRVHKPGDRKEYFEAETDTWQMFEAITRHRRRREVEPIIETITRCCDMVSSDAQKSEGKQAKVYRERLEQMLRFVEVISGLFNVVMAIGPRGIEPLTKMASRLHRGGRR
jgi:DNA-binding transcriptional regulator GbsR (MarR family)